MNDSSAEVRPVKVVGFDVPFFDLVTFLVKLAFAAIPATLIVVVLAFIIGSVLGAISGIPLSQ